MSDTKTFLFIFAFMASFNMLIGYYSVTATDSITNIDIPKLPSEAGILDYLTIAFQYIFLFFELVYFSIIGLPAFLALFVVVMDVVMAFLLIRLLRGTG